MNERLDQHIVLLGTSYLLLDDLNVDIVNNLPKAELLSPPLWIHKLQLPDYKSIITQSNELIKMIDDGVGKGKLIDLLIVVMNEQKSDSYWERIIEIIREKCHKLMLVTEDEIRTSGSRVVSDFLTLWHRGEVDRKKKSSIKIITNYSKYFCKKKVKV